MSYGVFTSCDGGTKFLEEGRARSRHFDGDGFVFGAVGEEDALAGKWLVGRKGFHAWGDKPCEACDSRNPRRMGNGKRVGQRRALAEPNEIDRARIMIEIFLHLF